MAYAISRILVDSDVEKLENYQPGGVGTIHKRHYKEIGDTVTQDELGVDDATWEAYYAEGVVSDDKPPKDWNPTEESLNRFMTRKAIETVDSLTAPAQAERVQQPTKQEKEATKK
jgi:hypothetical protein